MTEQRSSPDILLTPAPLVSIVLGTYNGETYLEEQLLSLLSQTYTALEIIVVDDGSKDGTLRILQEYASRDPRIKIFVNEHNLGFIRNFEKGCSLATGKWISLCDQDDYWLPEKVEKMVNGIGDSPMAYCDSVLSDAQLVDMGTRISDLVHYQSFDDCRQLCVFSRMYGHATLVTRTLFDRSRPFLEGIPHDGWLAFHATLYGGVTYIPEVLVKYRQHESNVFGVVGRKWKKKDTTQRAEKKRKELARVRLRMNAFCKACPEELVPQKRLLKALVETYSSFSLLNNWRRMILFFTNYRYLLVVKKYPTWRKLLFCLKMFVKIK